MPVVGGDLAPANYEQCPEQPKLLEPPDCIRDLGARDRLSQAQPNDRSDIVNRAAAVATVEHRSGERLQAVRLLGFQVIDDCLVPDRLDQQPLRSGRGNCPTGFS
jgi:hypothetical protein